MDLPAPSEKENTENEHRSQLHFTCSNGLNFPHFLTQNHLQNEFFPNFNSKKQDQNRINQDKKVKPNQRNLYGKTPENLDFPGFLTCFDTVCSAIYLLEN